MTGVHTKTRKTSKGDNRYLVYYTYGSNKERYAGSFTTKLEQKHRRDLIALEIALGRDPSVLLAEMRKPPKPTVGLDAAYEAYMASRVDVGAKSQEGYRNSQRRWVPILGANTDPGTITPQDIIDGIGVLIEELSPVSIGQYVSTLSQVLDYADVDPNPVLSRKVRLPKRARSAIRIPTTRAWFAIREQLPARSVTLLRLVECCGLRVSEASNLTWGAVDFVDGRVLVEDAKTDAGRRWLPVPPSLLDDLAGLCPFEDRRKDRRIVGFRTERIRYDLERACRAAASGSYSPHELRHRRLSLWYRHGIDPVTVKGWAGHTKTSMGLDTYAHVIIDDPSADEWLGFWKEQAGGRFTAPSRHQEDPWMP